MYVANLCNPLCGDVLSTRVNLPALLSCGEHGVDLVSSGDGQRFIEAGECQYKSGDRPRDFRLSVPDYFRTGSCPLWAACLSRESSLAAVVSHVLCGVGC